MSRRGCVPVEIAMPNPYVPADAPARPSPFNFTDFCGERGRQCNGVGGGGGAGA